jgi:hypothetical protein
VWRRTGWITQYQRTDDDDRVVEEYDRFGCMWYGEGPDGYRTGYGPACVTLAEAVAWTRSRCQLSFVDGLGGRRWSDGRPSDGSPPLPHDANEIAAAATSWAASSRKRWRVTLDVNLSIRDYEEAALDFPERLAAVADVVDTTDDTVGARLGARILVAAPGEEQAATLAVNVVRQALSDRPDGLRDEQGDVLGVSVTRGPAALRQIR